MLQANTQTDPIVEILRLAYRRGLVIRQEQEQKRSIDCGSSKKDDPLVAEHESPKQVESNNE